MRTAVLVFLLVALLVALAPRRGVAGASGSAGLEPYGGPPHGSPCPSGACPVCCAAEEVGLSMVPLRRPVFYRCLPDFEPILLAWPRGLVRPEDARLLQIHVGADFEGPGTLTFEATEGEVQHAPFDPVYLETRAPLSRFLDPDALRPGACVAWSLASASGEVARASFRLAEPDRSAAAWLDAIEGQLSNRAPYVRRLVRARALLDLDLALGAIGEVERVLAVHPDEPHAVALHHAALATVGLKGTPLWYDSKLRVRRVLDARAAGDEPCRVDRLDAPDPVWARTHGGADGGCGAAH